MVTHGSRSARGGFLTVDMMVAMAILLIAVVPLTLSLSQERRAARACYERAVIGEILDGELEILRAGAGKTFGTGRHAYRVRAESAANLPRGEFELVVEPGRLRLLWQPAGGETPPGGSYSREVAWP